MVMTVRRWQWWPVSELITSSNEVSFLSSSNELLAAFNNAQKHDATHHHWTDHKSHLQSHPIEVLGLETPETTLNFLCPVYYCILCLTVTVEKLRIWTACASQMFDIKLKGLNFLDKCKTPIQNQTGLLLRQQDFEAVHSMDWTLYKRFQ